MKTFRVWQYWDKENEAYRFHTTDRGGVPAVVFDVLAGSRREAISKAKFACGSAPYEFGFNGVRLAKHAEKAMGEGK